MEVLAMKVQIMFAASLAAVLATQSTAQSGQVPFSISAPGITASGTFLYQEVSMTGFAGTAWQVTGVNGTFADTGSSISGSFSGVLPSGMDYTKAPSREDLQATPPIVGNLGTVTGSPVTLSYGVSTKTSFDNLIYPNGDSPILCLPYYSYGGGAIDIFGLGLLVDAGGGTTALVNVWGNGDLNNPTNPLGLDYGISVGPYEAGGNPQYTRSIYIGDSNGYETDPSSYIGSGVTFTLATAVPEIDPAGMGAALAVIAGALGLLERRRLKTA